MVICMDKKRRRNNLPAMSLILPSKESHTLLKIYVVNAIFFHLMHYTIIHTLFRLGIAE
jgi:hypothetical protein